MYVSVSDGVRRTWPGPSRSPATNLWQRPTLLGLMLLIAYLAVGLAAIRADEAVWAGVIVYLTVFILSSATLIAIHRRGAWAGFAVFGWAYFLILDPNAAERGPASVSMIVAYAAARSFIRSNVPDYSLRAGLSMASVAMGLLGAVIGGRVARASETHPRPERNPADA